MGGKSVWTEVEIIRSMTCALQAELDDIKQDRARERLASAIYLARLRGALTDEEAERLARRGLRGGMEEAGAVVETVEALADKRWIEEGAACA